MLKLIRVISLLYLLAPVFLGQCDEKAICYDRYIFYDYTIRYEVTGPATMPVEISAILDSNHINQIFDNITLPWTGEFRSHGDTFFYCMVKTREEVNLTVTTYIDSTFFVSSSKNEIPYGGTIVRVNGTILGINHMGRVTECY
jgi:hypothetical protein